LNPSRGKTFSLLRKYPDQVQSLLSLPFSGYWGSFLAGYSGQGITLCTRLHLMLKFRMGGATPLLPLYVSVSSVIISTKYNKRRLSRVELTFVLEPPLYMCTTLFGGQQDSVQHKVAGCCDVCQGAHPVHLQRHWVCVTSALEHSLYNNFACMPTPLVTVAQFQLLHNLSPPPWSQCHFLTHNCCCPQSVQISDLV